MADNRTFGDMVSRITREIRRDGMTADIRASIQTAVDIHRAERFYFNETESTATATTGTLTLSLPTGLVEMDEFIFEETTSASNRFRMRHVSWEEIVQEQVTTNGFPARFAIYNQEIHIRPPSDRVLRGLISHQRDIELSACSTSTLSNAWTTDAEGLIRNTAKGVLFAGRLRNQQEAAVAETLAGRELSRLRTQTVKTIASSRITKTDF